MVRSASLAWRLASVASLAAMIALPMAARADATAESAVRTGLECCADRAALERPPTIMAALSEENLPAEDLPSPGATPGASPTGAPLPENSNGDWRQVSPGTEGQPAEPTDSNAAGMNGINPSPGAAQTGAMPDLQSGATQPTVAGPPPALDISTINTGPDLANASLEPEIRKAEIPSLAASLRLTEDARKELMDGKIDAALRELTRAVSIDSGNAFAYFYLGRSYLLRKNYQQALTFFKRAEIGFVSRPEWLGEAISFEGVCYEELGKMDEAEKAYQRALTSAPNNLMARVGYGRLAATNGPVGNLDAPPPERDLTAPAAGAADVPAPEEPPPPPPPDPNVGQ